MMWFVRMPSTNVVTNKRISPTVAHGFDYSLGYLLTAAPWFAMTMVVPGGICNMILPWAQRARIGSRIDSCYDAWAGREELGR